MTTFAWLALALAVAQPAPAMAPASPAPEPTEVAEVVVTARRSGVPIWRIGDERSSVLIVGTITAVPADVPWNSAALESAVGQSRLTLRTADVRWNIGDIFSLAMRARRYTRLPEGTRLAALVGPEIEARLAALDAAADVSADFREERPWWVALRLQNAVRRRAGRARSTQVTSLVGRAARRARVPQRALLPVRVGEAAAEMARERPTDAACLSATLDAWDAGPDEPRRRAEAWTRSRIQAVAESPISRMEASCWPESDARTGTALRDAWRAAVPRELLTPGAVVAMAPLTYLVERGGLLDDLQAQGYAIDGPAWR